jgi:hypothetical protein
MSGRIGSAGGDTSGCVRPTFAAPGAGGGNFDVFDGTGCPGARRTVEVSRLVGAALARAVSGAEGGGGRIRSRSASVAGTFVARVGSSSSWSPAGSAGTDGLDGKTGCDGVGSDERDDSDEMEEIDGSEARDPRPGGGGMLRRRATSVSAAA